VRVVVGRAAELFGPEDELVVFEVGGVLLLGS